MTTQSARSKKMLLAVAVALSLSTMADVAPLFDYRPMSHAEWSMPLLRPEALFAVIPCIALGVFLVAAFVSKRRRSPVALTLVACLAAVSFWLGVPLSDFDMNCFVSFLLSALGLGALSWIVAVFWFAKEKKRIKATCLFFLVPLLFFGWGFLFAHVTKHQKFNGSRMMTFSPCRGETYEEYLKRYRQNCLHYCPDCDKPMQSGYCYGRYWYCESCGRGKKRYEDALKRLDGKVD